MQRATLKIFAGGCFIIAVVGLVLNVGSGATIQTQTVAVTSGDIVTAGIPIHTDIFHENFTLYVNIDVEPNGSNWVYCNSIVLLVNESEYERFQQGTAIGNLQPLGYLQGTSTRCATYEITLAIMPQGPLHVIVTNLFTTSDSKDIIVNINTSTTSPACEWGLWGMACGTLIGIVALAGLLPGWKRYFLIGIGVNLGAFFVRMEQLPSFFALVSAGGDFFHVELYSDFQSLYLPWAEKLLAGTWPYSPALSAYPYPPLFILMFAAVSLLPGPQWLAALPLEAFTIGIGYLVYKLTITITHEEKKSCWAVLLYFLNPLTIIYGSYAWFNPGPFVFFVLLAFYLVLQRKEGWAMVSLGIATMFKQPALVFFPLVVFAIWKLHPSPSLTKNFVNLGKSAGMYLITILGISAPFLAVNADAYLQQVFLGQVGYSLWGLTIVPQNNWPVTINAFFAWSGFPASITVGLAYLLQWYFLLGACAVVIYLRFLDQPVPARDPLNDGESEDLQRGYIVGESLFAGLVLVFCLQLFFPHGSYKYYLILLVPFLALFHDVRDLNLIPRKQTSPTPFRWRFLLSFAISWVIFWVDRNLYFIILLGWVVFLLVERRRNLHCKTELKPQNELDVSEVENLTTNPRH